MNVDTRARGSWQSLLVVTPLFAAAEMRRQMTEAGARVRARLRPFVAEFLSDVQLSLRFNSLSSTGGKRICVTRNSPAFYFRLNRPAPGPRPELLRTVRKPGRLLATPAGGGGFFLSAGTITLALVSPFRVLPESFAGRFRV